MDSPSLLIPQWPAPKSVSALSTTRLGGVSAGSYKGFNLGDHVGDSEADVAANRASLGKMLGSDCQCQWLQQVHGVDVVEALPGQGVIQADAAFASQPDIACLVMTADCLPVLFCNTQGTRVAAAHAGWRGLAQGVLEATVSKMECNPGDLMCWLGPAIGPDAFEVGGEVREQFCDTDSQAQAAFKPSSNKGKWLADLYLLATLRLRKMGVDAIYGGGFCTYSDSNRFFSYRRDGVTGRMATLVWLNGQSHS